MNGLMDRLVDEWMDDQQLMMMIMIMMMRLMMIIISLIYKYPVGTEQCSTRHSPSASKSNSCILFKKTK